MNEYVARSIFTQLAHLHDQETTMIDHGIRCESHLDEVSLIGRCMRRSRSARATRMWLRSS